MLIWVIFSSLCPARDLQVLALFLSKFLLSCHSFTSVTCWYSVRPRAFIRGCVRGLIGYLVTQSARRASLALISELSTSHSSLSLSPPCPLPICDICVFLSFVSTSAFSLSSPFSWVTPGDHVQTGKCNARALSDLQSFKLQMDPYQEECVWQKLRNGTFLSFGYEVSQGKKIR